MEDGLGTAMLPGHVDGKSAAGSILSMRAARTARRGVALTAAVASFTLLAACSHSSPPAPTISALPSGRTLLREASRTMAAVTSARFSLQMQGSLGGLDVRTAAGVLTSEGA